MLLGPLTLLLISFGSAPDVPTDASELTQTEQAQRVELCRKRQAARYKQCTHQHACENPALSPGDQEHCEQCWDGYQAQVNQCSSAGSDDKGTYDRPRISSALPIATISRADAIKNARR